jgi:hypothetical protein
MLMHISRAHLMLFGSHVRARQASWEDIVGSGRRCVPLRCSRTAVLLSISSSVEASGKSDKSLFFLSRLTALIHLFHHFKLI